MRVIILLFILSSIFLTQCDNFPKILPPIPNGTPNETPNNGSGEIPNNELGETKKPEQNDELIVSEQYPHFLIGSFNDDYAEIFSKLTPPTIEDVHANTAISTFRSLSHRYPNAIMSPFLFTCDNNGTTTLRKVARLTNDKIKINSAEHLNLEVDKAVYFSANWEQKKLPELTNVNFLNSEVPGIKISGKCYYQKNEEMQLVYLPLDHKDFSVYLFLPNETDGLPQLLANMQFPQMNEAVQKLKKRNCEISIPAFRTYFNFATEKNQRVISFLQLDQQGCEFSSVHTSWKRKGNSGLGLMTGTEKSKLLEDDEELDLAKIKSPYLKNSSEKSIELIIDRPFFLVLRHLKTGEFLGTAAINNLQEISDWQNVTQYVTDNGFKKQTTLERFGWGYTRPKSKIEDYVPLEENKQDNRNQ